MEPENHKITEVKTPKIQQERVKAVENSEKKSKSWLVFTIIGTMCTLGGVACILFVLMKPEEILPDLVFPTIPSTISSNNIYSNLTGLPINNEADLTAPTYCIQTPNGTDGARPQVGLNEAGVVFEAIAEAGITRFAAIYQKPASAVIGPIRSLRLYYLQWDTPFDCTIVHAGGADDAIAAVRNGGYKDLTENYTYMYRGGSGTRRWNNLFTTASYLAEMNSDWLYGNSDIKGFKRMTPQEALKSRVDNTVTEKLIITKPTTANTSNLSPKITEIGIRFGWTDSFNVNYNYNASNNTYARSYANGTSHDIYSCPKSDLGEANPDTSCELVQLAPSVVVAMMVEERRAEDNYHEDITAVGSGTAYIFQNGIAIEGSWSKSSVADQIKFYDANGSEIALAPGQTFVEAVPNYGSVEY